jgi:hypothetical protein
MPYYIGPPPMNPVARLLAAVVAILALVGAFFFGLIILAVAIGVGVAAWLVLWLRMWWLRRKGGAARPRGSGGDPDDIIEVEYKVVSRRQSDDES